MKKLELPEIDVKEIINDCTSNMKNSTLVKRIKGATPKIEEMESNYIEKANDSELYLVNSHKRVGENVTKKEMNNLYDNKLVKKGQPGRKYYDEILNSAPHDICPYCMQRVVSTLDHYLPKTKFPAYSVSPVNLVPSCKDCNTGKLVDYATCEEDDSLHPYFDDVSSERWLFAKVLRTTPISFEFYTAPPSYWSSSLKVKIKNHFKNFELSELYTIHSAVEYCNLKTALESLYLIGGSASVKDFLERIATSAEDNNKNSWQTALYRTMADDVWFHSNIV